MDSSFTVATTESESVLSAVASMVSGLFLASCTAAGSLLPSALGETAAAVSAPGAGDVAATSAGLAGAGATAASFDRGLGVSGLATTDAPDVAAAALAGPTAGTAGRGLEPVSW